MKENLPQGTGIILEENQILRKQVVK